jgi:magnesium transporter
VDTTDTQPTQLEALRQALDSGALRHAGRLLQALTPAEIANLLESLPPEQRELVWGVIDTDQGGDVLVELNEEVRSGLISGMDSAQLVAAAANLDVDDLADLIAEVPEAVNREILRSLDASDRARLQSVLSYDGDSAGGLMNLDTLTVRADVTVEVVLRYLRMRKKLPAGTDAVFVVDAEERYLGCLFISDLLTSDLECGVDRIMDRKIPSIRAATPAHEVALIFENHDLVSAAVTNEQDQVLGRITVDDVVDVIREEASHSVLSMAGLDEDDDMFAPVVVSARRRSIWLGANLATAFLAAWIAGLFEHTLEQVVMLAILLPIVPSMGGIAGNQTLVLITRALALGQIERSNARWLLNKEFGVGLLNAAGLACFVALVTSWWFGTWKIGAVIAIALAINLVCAAVSGFSIPLLLKKMRIDPALAGGVVLTTITDVVGIAAFLGMGSLLLTE